MKQSLNPYLFHCPYKVAINLSCILSLAAVKSCNWLKFMQQLVLTLWFSMAMNYTVMEWSVADLRFLKGGFCST